MKRYIKLSIFSSSKPKNETDEAIKRFVEQGILKVIASDHYCIAYNIYGDSLKWWSVNKYYAYGNEIRFTCGVFSGPNQWKYYSKTPSKYYKNVLANIEHNQFTVQSYDITHVTCKENKQHDLVLIDGKIFCLSCKKFYTPYELPKSGEMFE